MLDPLISRDPLIYIEGGGLIPIKTTPDRNLQISYAKICLNPDQNRVWVELVQVKWPSGSLAGFHGAWAATGADKPAWPVLLQSGIENL
jgi:hypothetical protein